MFAAGCMAIGGMLAANTAEAGILLSILNPQLPNDSMFIEQWPLRNTGQRIRLEKGEDDIDMDVPEAWELIKEKFGESKLSEVTVAVLDSGINYNHQDLSGKILMDGSKAKGYDFVNNDSDPADDNGHGTIIAGIIAAKRNNFIGIAGIADKVKIMAVKVLDKEGIGSIENLKKGLRYAADNGAQVINMSLVGEYDSSVSDAVSYAHSKGAVIVCAAGSDNLELKGDLLRSPINNEGSGKNLIIGVSSIKNNGKKAENANCGNGIDISAPGVSIISAHHKNNFSYVYASGTSLAAANVSGIAALIKSCCPGMSNEKIKDAIINSAKTVAGLEGGMGKGIASAYEAVSYAINTVGNTEQVPSNQAEKSLIRLESEPTVYYILEEKRRGIPSLEVFNAWKFSFDNVEVLKTKEEIEFLPLGRMLGFPKGYVVKGESPTVYLICDNEIARPFTTPESFLGMGFKWEDIRQVTDFEILQSYIVGEAIK